MTTLETSSKEQQDKDTLELEMDLEIPVLEVSKHSTSELESLRSAYEAATAIRDELKQKLKVAVDYSNEQAKIIEEIKVIPSELEELKLLLGKTTENNNLLKSQIQGTRSRS